MEATLVYETATQCVPYKQRGVVLYPGQVVVIGARLGIVQGMQTIPIGESYTLDFGHHVYRFACDSAVTFEDGDQAHFHNDDREITDTEVGGGTTSVAGVVVGGKEEGETTVLVAINEFPAFA